jgi:cysteine desulfurase/selenocysteine lyase
MEKLPNFIGLETKYPTANNEVLQRLHLDGAASPLAATVAVETINALLPHYSNTHSYVHNSAQISTRAQAWAHDEILRVLSAAPKDYTAIFCGSGTTAGINRVARGLAGARPKRKVVLVSAMEHHANDIPHRQFDNQVVYFPLLGEGANMGCVDLLQFEKLCNQHAEQLNYVAVSSVSNVTGIQNPINEMVKIAHKVGALVLIDGAQSVAHQAIDMNQLQADFFVFSGHKVYTPLSPGVLIARKEALKSLSGQDLGGGSVASVSFYDYQLLTDYPDKEQSGTPNIVGAVALARVLQSLSEVGFAQIAQHDGKLMALLREGLDRLPYITVYGDAEQPRVGALAFNHKHIDHGLLAAVLNDYYAVAVRNECFCAHPYVSSLIKEELWQLDLSQVAEADQETYINQKRGMVRASISLYSTAEDIQRLLTVLQDIDVKIDSLKENYRANSDGSYSHKSFSIDWQHELGFDV